MLAQFRLEQKKSHEKKAKKSIADFGPKDFINHRHNLHQNTMTRYGTVLLLEFASEILSLNPN